MGWAFGDYLQTLLEQKEWSASKLARKAGLSHVYIRHLLLGEKTAGNKHSRISIDTMTALAIALEVPEYKLMLAYKGLDPDLVTVQPEEGLSLLREIHVSAAKCGIDLYHLTLQDRLKFEKSIMQKMRKILDILVEEDLNGAS
jgi:transcriptional regulator with XRE-family HTH domain